MDRSFRTLKKRMEKSEGGRVVLFIFAIYYRHNRSIWRNSRNLQLTGQFNGFNCPSTPPSTFVPNNMCVGRSRPSANVGKKLIIRRGWYEFNFTIFRGRNKLSDGRWPICDQHSVFVAIRENYIINIIILPYQFVIHFFVSLTLLIDLTLTFFNLIAWHSSLITQTFLSSIIVTLSRAPPVTLLFLDEKIVQFIYDDNLSLLVANYKYFFLSWFITHNFQLIVSF